MSGPWQVVEKVSRFGLVSIWVTYEEDGSHDIDYMYSVDPTKPRQLESIRRHCDERVAELNTRVALARSVVRE